jgi:hypothetical protein
VAEPQEGMLRGVDPLPSGPDGLVCSARGCRLDATTDLQWNNPRIHPPDRRKHWLACEEHRTQLTGFLSARGFLREVRTLPADGAADEAG